MENRTLNKILIVVIAVSLLGILITSILASPNFSNKLLKSSSNTETIISSDGVTDSESGDPSGNPPTSESSASESYDQNSSQQGSSGQNSYSSSSKENQAKNTLNKKYDLNTVTLEELLTVPNIGEKKAKAILELRTKLGKFTNVSQLKSVKGIGSKTYEKLKVYFYV